MEPTTKRVKVDRYNALVRIPASMIKSIDKRKRKIPLVVTYNNTQCIIRVDEKKLYKAGL